MFKAYFFDMDGVIYDSMPNHARAWEEVMSSHHLHFTARDCYINEGRTGYDVIYEALSSETNRQVSKEEIDAIYHEKTERFTSLGGALPMRGIKEVLAELKNIKTTAPQIWIVTGSGQQTLFDRLQKDFPDTFARERMITAFDVTHGKPHPEPYLRAWERSGFKKEECVVVENAPLGIRAGKAAGLRVIGVNTGILTTKDLQDAGADWVMNDMYELLDFIRKTEYVEE